MKISIIIPTYNEEKDIGIILRSLESQTIKPYEIFFIDGNSKDKTIWILEDFKKKHENVYVLSDKRFDRNRARNFGIKKSKGDILLILNADVKIQPNFIYHLSQFYSFNKDTNALLINSKPILELNDRYSKFYDINHKLNYSKNIYNKVDWTEGFSCINNKIYFPFIKNVDLKGGEDSYLIKKKIKSKSFFLALNIEHKTPSTLNDFIKEKMSRGRGNIHAHIYFLNKGFLHILIKVITKLIMNLTSLKNFKYFFKKEFYIYFDLYFIEGLCFSLGEILELSKYRNLKSKKVNMS